jgi:phosphoribosyl-AMP cyclohydrolase
MFLEPLSGAEQNETTELRPRFDQGGLLPAIAQDADTGEVLMLAWMNAEALQSTLATGRAVYWSRSRQLLWRKGDTSGHEQHVVSVWIDCDQDAVLLKVRQIDSACHTGRRSCFYRTITNGRLVAD